MKKVTSFFAGLNIKRVLFLSYVIYLGIDINLSFPSEIESIQGTNFKILFYAKWFSLVIYALGYFGNAFNYKFRVSKHVYDLMFVLAGYLLATYYFIVVQAFAQSSFTYITLPFQLLAISACYQYIYGKNGVWKHE